MTDKPHNCTQPPITTDPTTPFMCGCQLHEKQVQSLTKVLNEHLGHGKTKSREAALLILGYMWRDNITSGLARGHALADQQHYNEAHAHHLLDHAELLKQQAQQLLNPSD